MPILLTLVSGAFVACLEGQLNASVVVLLLLIGGLQAGMRAYESVFERLVPIELLDVTNSLQRVNVYRVVALALAGVPLLSLVSEALAWVVWGAVIIACIPDMILLYKRVLSRQSIMSATLATLRASETKVAVYMSGLESVAYQINQWLPALERLGIPVVIVVRQRGIYDGMTRTPIPVVYARNAAHLEKVLNCGIVTVLYPANPMHNLQSLRYFRLNHYFINHGESDKAVNQNKLLQAYDKLLVAGPLANRRMLSAGLKFREGQVEYVGRPQAELQLKRMRAGDAQSICRILYAPTWEGFVDEVNYSSVNELGLQLLTQLVGSKKYEIVFKPHPYTGTRRAEQKSYLSAIRSFCKQNGVVIKESLDSIHECMNNSDLLITDISSVLNDYLITDKPIILCVNERMATMDLFSEFPSSRAAYHVQTSSDIGRLVEEINTHDGLRERREEVRKDSLGDFPEGAMNRFRSVIEQSLDHV